MKAHQFGTWGENIAAEYLQSKGLQILSRNWRCAEGEIDLVALEGETIVMVEVRTRSSHHFGTPEESLTYDKQRRLERTALAYLEATDQLQVDWRVDIIAIDANRAGKIERIEHYLNAIDGVC